VIKANDWMLKEDRDLLAARNNEWRRSWEKTRGRGKLRFILLRYVLIWGGLQIGLEVVLHLDLFHGPHARDVYGCSAFTLLMAFLLGLFGCGMATRSGTSVGDVGERK
jgi:hypothetical protein